MLLAAEAGEGVVGLRRVKQAAAFEEVDDEWPVFAPAAEGEGRLRIPAPLLVGVEFAFHRLFGDVAPEFGRKPGLAEEACRAGVLQPVALVACVIGVDELQDVAEGLQAAGAIVGGDEAHHAREVIIVIQETVQPVVVTHGEQGLRELQSLFFAESDCLGQCGHVFRFQGQRMEFFLEHGDEAAEPCAIHRGDLGAVLAGEAPQGLIGIVFEQSLHELHAESGLLGFQKGLHGLFDRFLAADIAEDDAIQGAFRAIPHREGIEELFIAQQHGAAEHRGDESGIMELIVPGDAIDRVFHPVLRGKDALRLRAFQRPGEERGDTRAFLQPVGDGGVFRAAAVLAA